MSRRGGGTPATAALDAAGIAYTVRSYEHDPAAASYGLEAATALDVPPERVLKTLLVTTGTDLHVAVVPVDRKLDLKAMATAVGAKKVTMAEPRAAERSTGYVVGGISPIGQRRPLPTVVDAGATGFDTILVSGGRRGLDLELSPHDLITITRATVAPIAGPPSASH